MCVNPGRINGPDGVVMVGCRECWQCRQTRIDDWVGRNIAERKTAKAAHAVTLTYGSDRSTGDVDNIRAAVLTYSDIRKMMAHLRVDGYPARFFLTGEYGSAKGRAHWHILLYWQGKVPKVELRESFFLWNYWKHGWSYWDDVTPESARYCCKYLVKEMADDQAAYYGPRMSKHPPLGDAYFRELAARYVAQGLAPQDLSYGWSDVCRKDRTQVRFLMQGKTATNFLDYYLEALTGRPKPEDRDDLWQWIKSMRHPGSKLVDEYLDRLARPYLEDARVERMERDALAKRKQSEIQEKLYGPRVYNDGVTLGVFRPKGGGAW